MRKYDFDSVGVETGSQPNPGTPSADTDVILKDYADDNFVNKDSSTGAANLPAGTTGQRPGSPAAGMFRYNSDTGQFEGYTNDWGEIAGGGSGGINQFTNPDAEANENDWDRYADAAASTPDDATGGTPNVTWTRSDSSPLRGSGHFIFTKDAANRQGEGVATTLDFDNADKNSVLGLSFDYDGSLDTDYADGDLTFYIYDVTNDKLITPSRSNEIKAARTSYQGTWVSTDSTNYKFVIHVASTEAAAYIVGFDNFKSGPELTPQGVPVEDSVTVDIDDDDFNNSTGLTITGTITGKRVSSELILNVNISFVGTGSVSSPLTLELPAPFNGLAVMNGFYPGGTGRNDNSTATSRSTFLFGIKGDGSTAIGFTGASGGTSYNGNVFGDSGSLVDQLQGTFTLPIAAWAGSSVNLSVAKAEYYSSTTGTWDAAAATTDTVIGPSGSPITGSLASNRNKDIQLLRALQPTDRADVEVKVAGQWVSAQSLYPYTIQNALNYGIRLIPLTATTVRVSFGRYATATGATYGSAGANWATGVDWRLVVYPGVMQSADPDSTLPTAMSDSTATRMGRKTYLHGTTYAGGNAPTVAYTVNSGLVVERALFIPYQMQDGEWRLKFQIEVSGNNATNHTMSVDGVLFKNVSGYDQAVTARAPSTTTNAYANDNTNQIIFSYSSATTVAGVFGDVELESKPTWAY